MLTFSIVVPAYNEEKYIGGCLKCLQKQEGDFEYEIIVVDNNSSDKTIEIAKKCGVKVVKELQQGVIWAKQRGFLEAKGKYVAITDADTKPPKDWLKQAYESLSAPGVVGVTGPIEWFDSPKWFDTYAKWGHKSVYWVFKYAGKTMYIAGANMAFVREKFSGFDTRLGVGEDEVGVLKKLIKNGRVVYNRNMVIPASGRRAQKGMWSYSSELISKYLVGYFLASKLKLKNKFEFAAIR